MNIDLGFRTKHSLNKLFSAHFKAKDQYRIMTIDTTILRHVQSQGCLTHRRTSRNNIQTSRLESSRYSVKLIKTSAETCYVLI
ncbi:hypothetical protein SDC9_163052 [bioreactor metagenome]|uniref:Uncharacterized protein n=1 Tax=bioreactor metagenome TaxID=1076179 RepID=A0A645FMR8_9ZZZZ